MADILDQNQELLVVSVRLYSDRTRCCQKETSLPVNMETTEERKLLSMVSC